MRDFEATKDRLEATQRDLAVAQSAQREAQNQSHLSIIADLQKRLSDLSESHEESLLVIEESLQNQCSSLVTNETQSTAASLEATKEQRLEQHAMTVATSKKSHEEKLLDCNKLLEKHTKQKEALSSLSLTTSSSRLGASSSSSFNGGSGGGGGGRDSS